MDAEVAKKLEEFEARLAAVESFLGDIEDGAADPIVSQHREFAAMVRAKREAQE